MRKMKKTIFKIAGAVLFLNVIFFGEHFITYATDKNDTITKTENEYTIRYELNGGTNNEENPKSYIAGTGVSSFQAPYKFEHNFEGWYFDADFQNKAESLSSDISGNIVLYAKWSLYNYDYTIYYNTNYGFNGETNPSGYYEGVGVHTLDDAVRRGYTFEGWYLKDDKAPYTTKVESIGENSSGDIHIEAKFTPNVYNIEYVLNGGTLSAEAPFNYTYAEGIKELPTPVMTSKRLEGWYTDEKLTKKITSIGRDTIGDITLYAKWKDAEAESIKLSTSALSLKQDSTAQLSVTEILPEDTANKRITYRSSNPAIATVDAYGRITAKAAGTAIIYAKVGNIESSCTVKVLPYTAVFRLSNYNVKTTKTVATRIQLDTGDKVKKYTSSNSKIATVNSKGVVKGKRTGTVKITAVTVKGAKAVCTVKVSKNIVKTQKITVKKSKVVLKKGAAYKIKVKISPSNSTEKVTYKSSKTKTASVNSKGVIKAKRKGNCVITVKSGKKSKRILLTVK